LYELFIPTLQLSANARIGAIQNTATGTTGHLAKVGFQFAQGQFLDSGFTAQDIRTWLETNLDYWGATGNGAVDFYWRNRTSNDLQAVLGEQIANPRINHTYTADINWYVVKQGESGLDAGAEKRITILVGEAGEATNDTASGTFGTWSNDINLHINGRNNTPNQNAYASTHKYWFIAHWTANETNIINALKQFDADLLGQPIDFVVSTTTATSTAIDPTVVFNAVDNITSSTVDSASVSVDPSALDFTALVNITSQVIDTESLADPETIWFYVPLGVEPSNINSASANYDPSLDLLATWDISTSTVDSVSVSPNLSPAMMVVAAENVDSSSQPEVPEIIYTVPVIANAEVVDSSSTAENPFVLLQAVLVVEGLTTTAVSQPHIPTIKKNTGIQLPQQTGAGYRITTKAAKYKEPFTIKYGN
jgi:hypothetical protein